MCCNSVGVKFAVGAISILHWCSNTKSLFQTRCIFQLKILISFNVLSYA